MTQLNSVPQTNVAPRYDMYMPIHKAIRAFMNDTLDVLGRMDVDDTSEVAAALAQLRELLHICDKHLEKENHFVHVAMERRQPGSTAQIADEHVGHERDIAQLRAALVALEAASAVQRRALALSLYREVALFVAHNFEHMQREEVDHNAVLWSAYSDAELMQIEAELKASIPPQDMAVFARWLLSANDHAFRVAMLSGVRAHAPTEVFEMLLGLARAHLSERDWRKVAGALELPLAA